MTPSPCWEQTPFNSHRLDVPIVIDTVCASAVLLRGATQQTQRCMSELVQSEQGNVMVAQHAV